MIDRVTDDAVSRAIDRLAAQAEADVPTGVTVERTEEGLRLTGPGLIRGWASDVRLWGLTAGGTR